MGDLDLRKEDDPGIISLCLGSYSSIICEIVLCKEKLTENLLARDMLIKTTKFNK